MPNPLQSEPVRMTSGKSFLDKGFALSQEYRSSGVGDSDKPRFNLAVFAASFAFAAGFALTVAHLFLVAVTRVSRLVTCFLTPAGFLFFRAAVAPAGSLFFTAAVVVLRLDTCGACGDSTLSSHSSIGPHCDKA